MELIKKCICGGIEFSETYIENDINLKACLTCDVPHQIVNLDRSGYFDFYNKYHGDYQTETGGLAPHKERYNHDIKISNIRFSVYKPLMLPSGKTLDMGSSNGAFVDCMLEKGYDAWGIEIGDDVDKSDRIYQNDFLDLDLQGPFVLITLHDVFEHLINPTDYLDKFKEIMNKDSLLVIDIPDYFHERGLHHWRKIQHLWYFNESQLKSYFTQEGFTILQLTYPIPGKMVFYLKCI